VAVLYRSMRPDPDDGLPILTNGKRWGLGPRLPPDENADMFPDEDGNVRSLGGGISCSDDWRKLPAGFRPPALDGTSKREIVFEIDREIAERAFAVRKHEPPPGHYVLEPKRKMPIQTYEELLSITRREWRVTNP
jgi:hypothetical protein